MMSGRLWLLPIALALAAGGGSMTFRYKDPAAVEPPQDDAFSDTLTSGDPGFERAYRPRPFSFPDDFGPHERFRTEWWYFTGNLQTGGGRQFGYELTFFRFALTPHRPASTSAWRTNQLYMAHFALTDAETGRFLADERFSRAASGLAGARNERYHVWLYDWKAEGRNNDGFPIRLQAGSGAHALDLNLKTQDSPVLQGDRGLSQKSAEPGNASYYYSYPRITTEGIITADGKSHRVTGESWMDREWSTSALAKEQAGWDWFALQLDNRSELMFYRFRRKDGRPDPNSTGAWFPADRSKLPLTDREVVVEVLGYWKSPHSKITYPARWRLSVPGQKLSLEIVPLINDQELNLSYRYWEGAVSVRGRWNGKEIEGKGYVELTGY
ncbi:putative secreted hydrolase [Methylomicrobium album BG8]|uniref:Putative secreted hydrolase n=2 Tax=Methylomicrobium album TaxID=39775 RepID=H8GMS4_METAL|nr:putative secreted hydrolase [Methylomicrobium album BG8]